MKVKELLLYATDFLKQANIENPRLEAEIMLSHVLKKDKIFLITHDNDEVFDEADENLKKLLNRRIKNEPMAYILGYKEFYGRKFFVNDGVLIPRPETELLIELVKNKSNVKILDLCAGSGCIGLTLAAECENADATLSDISHDAAEVIKKNAELLGLKVNVIESDLFQNIEDKFDVIVCNPPYIESKVINDLESDVKDYEPRIALDGGEDGLDFYKKIIPFSKNYLFSGGSVYFEIGYNEGNAVKNLFEENGFCDVKIYKDLAGLDRIVCGRFFRIQ